MCVEAAVSKSLPVQVLLGTDVPELPAYYAYFSPIMLCPDAQTFHLLSSCESA